MAALMRTFAVTILIASSAVAQSGVTGTWSGTYAMSIQLSSCQNKPLTWRGNPNCATIATLTQQLAVAGTVSGSTFTGAAFDPAGTFDFPFSATIGGGGISGSAAGASPTTTTGTFTLTQSSAQVPASDFSGRY